MEVAAEKFEDYKAGTEPKPEFKATILNTIMSKDVQENPGVLKDWEDLWKKYIDDETSAAEKQTIYYALGLIQDEDTLLKWVFSKLSHS
jgi:hypothetical protein